jgi:hypothetical protein
MRTINNTITIGFGVAALTAAALTISSPAAAAANSPAPTRIPCAAVDIDPACDVPRVSSVRTTEQEALRTPVWTGDAKDHPGYGQVTPDAPYRADAKDHPDYAS